MGAKGHEFWAQLAPGFSLPSFRARSPGRSRRTRTRDVTTGIVAGEDLMRKESAAGSPGPSQDPGDRRSDLWPGAKHYGYRQDMPVRRPGSSPKNPLDVTKKSRYYGVTFEEGLAIHDSRRSDAGPDPEH